MEKHDHPHKEDRPTVLDGDRLAFNRLVEPFLEELLSAARRDLGYHRFRGEPAARDITAEELVGETLLRAWASRHERPEGVSLRAWLLGTQHRVLRKLIERPRWERDLWAISLDEPLPPEPLYDDEESFWEWYQPDDIERWEDVFPDNLPNPEEDFLLKETETYPLEVDERQALLLFDEHKLSMIEVAYALGVTVERAAEMVHNARRRIREERARQSA
ncbi:RNA polymerase sigma factor [Rhodocaloribacter sp.]